MDLSRWPAVLRARVGTRTLNILQIFLILALASMVLLRDSLGIGIELSLNTSAPVETEPRVDSVDLIGPKRNIASVAEKTGRELELVPEPVATVEEHPPARHKRKHKHQIIPVNVTTPEPSVVKELDQAVSIESEKPARKQEKPKRRNSKNQPKVEQQEDHPVEQLQLQEDRPVEQLQEKEEVSLEQNVLINSTQSRNFTIDDVEFIPEGASMPFSLGKSPKNWDQQRLGFLEKFPHLKTTPSGKPRMLMVSGSQPWACKNPVGDHLLLKSMKNKMDYCRQHDIEMFYNFAHIDKEMTSYWAKLPILRRLMLSHPEIEWFFWMDADAMFTDMLFDIPMERYGDYNLVMWGYDKGLYEDKSWVGINNGVFFLRNSQWALDLFDMWAPMGPAGRVRDSWGKLFTDMMTQRPVMPADDQSALVYLMLTQPELDKKIKLEWDYEISGYWADFVDKFEDLMVTNHPGLGDKRWPFVTHFTGCQPCSGHNNPVYTADICATNMERAFNFADNQVLQMMGYQHENLNSAYVRRVKQDSDQPLDIVGRNPWTTSAETYGL